MEKQNANWEKIEHWINSSFGDIGFYNMPMKECLDKSSLLRIMKSRMFGSYEQNYLIKDFHENLKSDTEIAILAIELNLNNYFNISNTLKASIDFHKLLICNQYVEYEYILRHSPVAITGNKDFVNQIISDYPSIYSSLTEELRLDRAILYKVLEKKIFPEYLPNKFSDDKEVILKLIEVQSFNYERGKLDSYYDISWLLSFISKELLNDRDIILKLFKSNKNILLKIPDYLMTDKKLILSAVKSNPKLYESLCEDLITNHSIAVEAFVGDYKLFLKYSGNYKFQYRTILKFIKRFLYNESWDEFDELNEEFSVRFEKIANKLIEIKMLTNEIASHLASVCEPFSYIKFYKTLDPDTQKNKNIVIGLFRAVDIYEILEKECEMTTKSIYENIVLPLYSNDREVILEIFSIKPSLFDGVPVILKGNEDTIIKTSRLIGRKKRIGFLNSLTNDYCNNRTFILKLLKEHLIEDFGKNKNIFCFASDLLIDDDDFVKEAIKIQPQSILYASKRIKNDIEYQMNAFNSFQKIRKQLRKQHGEANRYDQFRLPFFDGKSDYDLDLWFLNKNCKKLLKNKKYKKYKISDSNGQQNFDTLPF